MIPTLRDPHPALPRPDQRPPRPGLSPMIASAKLRLGVAAAASLVLWLAILWAVA